MEIDRAIASAALASTQNWDYCTHGQLSADGKSIECDICDYESFIEWVLRYLDAD